MGEIGDRQKEFERVGDMLQLQPALDKIKKRDERLARALRVNLLRRKAQARKRQIKDKNVAVFDGSSSDSGSPV